MLANGVKKSVRCGFSRIVDFFCVGQKTAELQTTADQLLEGQTDIKALVEKLSEQQQATESKLLGQITDDSVRSIRPAATCRILLAM